LRCHLLKFGKLENLAKKFEEGDSEKTAGETNVTKDFSAHEAGLEY